MNTHTDTHTARDTLATALATALDAGRPLPTSKAEDLTDLQQAQRRPPARTA